MALRDRPVLAAAAGAACIASSATLVSLADTAPATAATFRCLYALPFLGVLMLLRGPTPGSRARSAPASLLPGLECSSRSTWCSGITRSRPSAPASPPCSGNLQVVIVGFIAWWWLGERPSARLIAAVPFVLIGVVLISGVVGDGAYGKNPMLGVVFGAATSLAYAGFLLVLREGSKDLRRAAGPLFDATAVGAVFCIALGPVSGGVDLVPSWPSHGWLLTLAITSQVAGWLLIAISLPRVPAALTSVVLLAAAGRVSGAGRSRARRAAVGGPADRMRHRAGGGGGGNSQLDAVLPREDDQVGQVDASSAVIAASTSRCPISSPVGQTE